MRNDTKVCEDPTCDGTMTIVPRNPLTDEPPKWVCDSCGAIQYIDDDPGTAPMFGAGGAD